MKFVRNFSFTLAVIALLLACSSVGLFAQGPAEPSVATPDPAAAKPEPVPNPVPKGPAQATTSDSWRGMVSIYGWFPGIHGTAGVADHDLSVHAPFSDVFHYLKGVIPIAVEADKGRFVMPLDYFWVKLGDDKTLPINDLGQTNANLHITESIFTPKFGYRIYDGEHLKFDALAGIRYWYVGQNLTLYPSGVSNHNSANWVDGLGGARFILPLGEKASVTVSGDVGGGGAHLDYMALGLFMYNITPKLGLGLGWRYLDVDYQPTNHGFLYDVAQSGALAGMYFNFGGKPPVPPSAACSLSPTEVYAGEPISARVSTQYFNPKHELNYNWATSGGKIPGTGTTASVDTTGLQPGNYAVTAKVTDPKEKKNNVASCSAGFTVKARPNYPPTASCSVTPRTIAINQSAAVTMTASSPENRPLTYNWTSTGGQLSGAGASATVVATNADAGSTITVTGTTTDDHGLTASCSANVTVPAVEKVKEVEDWGECTFEKNPKKPWRVDNDCKDVLDKVALRLQQMPNGKVAVVGYNAQEEVVEADQIGSQRAVNVKYYMCTDELGPKVDATRVEPRKGGAKGKKAHFYFVPQGATFAEEESVTVDESAVKGQSRTAPAPAKKAKKAAPVATN